MCSTNDSNNRQGHLLAGNYVLIMSQRVWPVHIYDPAGSIKAPYPMYRGSARIEGDEGASLYKTFIERGFQPCVLHVQGVRYFDKDLNSMRSSSPEGGMHYAAVVRYTEVGYPEIRIVTTKAPEEFTKRSGWNRVPVRVQGTSDKERYHLACEIVRGTRRENELESASNQAQTTQAAEVCDTADPFAA